MRNLHTNPDARQKITRTKNHYPLIFSICRQFFFYLTLFSYLLYILTMLKHHLSFICLFGNSHFCHGKICIPANLMSEERSDLEFLYPYESRFSGVYKTLQCILCRCILNRNGVAASLFFDLELLVTLYSFKTLTK